MKQFLIITSAVFIIGCNANDQRNKKAAIDKLVKLAVLSDSLRDLDNSIKFYTEILELEPNKLFALNNRGRALVWAGQMDKGLADFNKCIKLYPSAATYYTRAIAYIDMKRFDKAKSDLEKCLELDPGFGKAYFGLSCIQENKKQYDTALYLCNKAAGLNCPADILIMERSVIYMKMGNHSLAINELTSLINLGSKEPVCFNNRGYEKNKLHEYKEAIEDFNQAIKLDVKMAFAYNNKASALLHLGHADSALKYVTISLQLNDKNPFAFKTRGEVNVVFHNKDKACADFARAINLSNDPDLVNEIEQLKKTSCN
jgi:tetratricopeptide (TPR) repeat protein